MTAKKNRVSPARRRMLLAGVAAPALAGAPWIARHAHAQADLGAYQSAKINWRQAEGEKINVAVIPAGYFDALIALTPQFQALTGITVGFEKVPPGQIRQKAILDLSSKGTAYATHAADPMYYDLYVSNKWVEPIERYLSDPKLTDAAWYQADDIIPAWRGANSVQGRLYGVPFDGESTLQIYRKDLYDAKGLKPAETFDELVKNAAAVHDPANRLWGAALRGFKGAGQNMYIYPSILRAFGGEWSSGGTLRANSREAVAALEWYVELLSKYAPPAVRNWNWPDLADAFSQSTLGLYIDANTSASVLNNPERSKVLGKIGYARWPRGPSGRRVSSIWNWGFPINAALTERAKRATWLFIAWASSAETQARTSWKASGPVKRLGLNRLSLWQSKPFETVAGNLGANFLKASIDSMREDLDVEWRPRMPQWPAVGETLATAIQAALVGQQKPKEALDEAQTRIAQLLKG
jgi:ABC-type glycerol-3-phosphate transport system substrate-binding protein